MMQSRLLEAGNGSIGEAGKVGVASAPLPPAASFFDALKKSLAANSIQLSNADFEACLSKLIASSADCPAFLDYAIPKCMKAKAPASWFVQGITKWDWIGKWRANGADKSRQPHSNAKQASHTPTTEEMRAEREAATPEEERVAAVKAAQFKADHGVKLDEKERELLGLPAPPVTVPADTFEDDLPEVSQ
jgi:hypothetical protein